MWPPIDSKINKSGKNFGQEIKFAYFHNEPTKCLISVGFIQLLYIRDMYESHFCPK